MASHHLIDEHLAVLARDLPSDSMDEVADGLIETWRRHLATGRPPADAARAAIAEFGTPEQITAAFVAHAPGRRVAAVLLATGPAVGLCWGASLITARAWTWQVPTGIVVTYGVSLLTVVAILVAAVSSRTYRRTRLGTVGSIGLTLLDLTMLTAVATLASAVAWPMLLAVPASLARIALTVRSLPAAVAA